MSSTTPNEPSRLDSLGVRRRSVAAGVLTVILITSYVYAPWCETGFILCPLRAMAGLDCPGCGLTRSFCAMAHGQFARAAAFHWLGPLFFISSMAAIPLLIVEVFRRRKFSWFHRFLFSPRLAYVLAGVLILHWAVDMVRDGRSGALLVSIKGSILGGLASGVLGWIA